MTEERKKEILSGVLELLEEYNTLDLDVNFPDNGCSIHIEVEENKNVRS